MREREHRVDRGEGDGALGLETIEGARIGEAFERLLVDRARIDPAR